MGNEQLSFNLLSFIYRESTLRVNMSLINSQMTNMSVMPTIETTTEKIKTWENNWGTALFKYTYKRTLKVAFSIQGMLSFSFSERRRDIFFFKTYELIRVWKDEKGSSQAPSWCVINMPEYIFQYANLLEAITNI